MRDNIILAQVLREGSLSRFSNAKAYEIADEYINLSIATASADTPIKSLSGGNQQKAILARWCALRIRIIWILDEPTPRYRCRYQGRYTETGIKLASEGMSVTIYLSPSWTKCSATCSRLVVMRDGRMVGELFGTGSQTRIRS